MSNPTLFPATVALVAAPKAKRLRRSEKSQQLAYLQLLSRIVNRPVGEVVSQVAAGNRLQPTVALAKS